MLFLHLPLRVTQTINSRFALLAPQRGEANRCLSSYWATSDESKHPPLMIKSNTWRGSSTVVTRVYVYAYLFKFSGARVRTGEHRHKQNTWVIVLTLVHLHRSFWPEVWPWKKRSSSDGLMHGFCVKIETKSFAGCCCKLVQVQHASLFTIQSFSQYI